MGTMNEDMPWVIGLSDEEIQELRTNKQQLTQYGRKKIRKLMNNYIPDDDVIEEIIGEKLTEEKKEELAKMREENTVIAKVSEEDYQKVLNAIKEKEVLEIAKNFMEENKEAFQHLAAIERQELAKKSFDELTKDQKIQLALEEVDWIVIGGQDGEEFYNSIQFIRRVLKSLQDT